MSVFFSDVKGNGFNFTWSEGPGNYIYIYVCMYVYTYVFVRVFFLGVPHFAVDFKRNHTDHAFRGFRAPEVTVEGEAKREGRGGAKSIRLTFELQ